MLRSTPTCLGRWSSRDFLRGRSKRAGAVHTRHTHGRQGRYKRLSSLCSSTRDGRRHASNHMQGGLGIKLGGGLFGLRIPRQHQLSHISKEDYDLEVYGHPNITNPYRDHLDEHPDLKSVMMNASVAMKMVVLMPRVSRHGGRSPAENFVPATWRKVVREVSAALASLALTNASRATPGAASASSPSSPLSATTCPPVEIHFATLETSVCCRWSSSCVSSSSLPSDSVSSSGEVLSSAAELEASVARLYRAHCKLGHVLKLERPDLKTASHSAASRVSTLPSPTRHSRRPAVFMGAALKAPGCNSSSSSSSIASSSSTLSHRSAAPPPSSANSFTSSVLAQLTKNAAASAAQLPITSATQSAAADAPVIPFVDGVAGVVHRLSATEKPMLRVCIRPTECGTVNTNGASVALSPPSSSLASSLTRSTAPRRVLRADVDANAEVGVWCLSSSPLHELLRWHYCAQDPRAHNHDALPHHRRHLPLLLVADYSTVELDNDAKLSASGRQGGFNATLMPRRLSLDLESAGFRLIKETTLRGATEAIARWSPSAQWDKMAHPVVSWEPHTEEHSREAACASS